MSLPAGYEDVPYRSRKKTRHWCKGKVGVSHQWEWKDWYEVCHLGPRSSRVNYRYDIQVCSVCQRQGLWRKVNLEGRND